MTTRNNERAAKMSYSDAVLISATSSKSGAESGQIKSKH
jgi:hypothetical protein